MARAALAMQPTINVNVPGNVAREAARIADRENIAMEDALRRLTVYHRETERPPWVPAEAPVMVVAVDAATADWATDHDLPTATALGRMTAFDYPTDRF